MSDIRHTRCSVQAARPTLTAMSFARPRLALGLAPRILATQRSAALRSSIVAYRNIHSTHCSHAEHIDSRFEGPIRSPPLGAGSLTAKDEPGKDIDPYKDGQSAIDKAVHLFFFTEIIRGMCVEIYLIQVSA